MIRFFGQGRLNMDSNYLSKTSLAAFLRLLLLVLLVLTGIVLMRTTPLGDLFSETAMQSYMRQLRDWWWAPLVLIGLYALVSVTGLPVGPLLLGGAAFGVKSGTLYNTIGLISGAALAYFSARLLGRAFIMHIAGKRLKRFEKFCEYYGFWPLVQIRFLPIPFAAINFGAALAGVRPLRFLSASALGLLPSSLIHTYFVAKLFETAGNQRIINLVLYISILVVFNLLLTPLWARKASS
jgi:uncharacterized membrane protein YdjX (TVP38/TMEM64 family)